MMKALRIASYPLIMLWLALGIFAAVPALVGVAEAWRAYLWFAAGAGAYIVLRRLSLFSKNEEWMQVFSHELAHTAVGLMFFQRIHSFNADAGRGRVSYSGSGFGDIFISLAPYCLPLITYILLLLRTLGAEENLYIFDLLIGFTTAFYAICFRAQTGTHQSDITDQGTVRGLLFIVAAWVFNATVILLSVRSGFTAALLSIGRSYREGLVKTLHELVQMI